MSDSCTSKNMFGTKNVRYTSDSCTSKNMLGTKNVRYGGISKASENQLNHKYFKDCASQTFVATILVTYVTMLTEPDLSLKN